MTCTEKEAFTQVVIGVVPTTGSLMVKSDDNRVEIM